MGWCISYLPVEGEEDPAGESQHLHQLEQLRPVARRRRRLKRLREARAIISACPLENEDHNYGGGAEDGDGP
jgi:hypothetical protein